MVRFFESPFAGMPKLTITAAIDILIVAILIYQFILILRGRRAFQWVLSSPALHTPSSRREGRRGRRHHSLHRMTLRTIG